MGHKSSHQTVYPESRLLDYMTGRKLWISEQSTHPTIGITLLSVILVTSTYVRTGLHNMPYGYDFLGVSVLSFDC